MSAMPSCVLYFALCLVSVALGAWSFADWLTHGAEPARVLVASCAAALLLLMFMIEADMERVYRWLMGVKP